MAFVTGAIYLIVERLARSPRWVRTAERLEAVTYRAIWANACWGRYWSWDPKETWSLVTWIIYSTCLHLPYVSGWKGRWAAWIAILGFVSVVFTYLSVNYLLASIHDYA